MKKNVQIHTKKIRENIIRLHDEHCEDLNRTTINDID